MAGLPFVLATELLGCAPPSRSVPPRSGIYLGSLCKPRPVPTRASWRRATVSDPVRTDSGELVVVVASADSDAAPVSAIVELLRADMVVAWAMTDSAGRATLRVTTAPTRYALRVRAIAFWPWREGDLDVRAGGRDTVDVRLDSSSSCIMWALTPAQDDGRVRFLGHGRMAPRP